MSKCQPLHHATYTGSEFPEWQGETALLWYPTSRYDPNGVYVQFNDWNINRPATEDDRENIHIKIHADGNVYLGYDWHWFHAADWQVEGK